MALDEYHAAGKNGRIHFRGKLKIVVMYNRERDILPRVEFLCAKPLIFHVTGSLAGSLKLFA